MSKALPSSDFKVSKALPSSDFEVSKALASSDFVVPEAPSLPDLGLHKNPLYSETLFFEFPPAPDYRIPEKPYPAMSVKFYSFLQIPALS